MSNQPTKAVTTPSALDILKATPVIWGYNIEREKEELLDIKGIHLKVLKFTTIQKTSGYRVSLLENHGTLFEKFNEFLLSAESVRPPDEKMISIFSYTTLLAADKELIALGEAGFYIYRDHLIFHEEEKAAPPFDRLNLFIEYYKKKFEIQVRVGEEDFSDLDKLERA